MKKRDWILKVFVESFLQARLNKGIIYLLAQYYDKKHEKQSCYITAEGNSIPFFEPSGIVFPFKTSR